MYKSNWNLNIYSLFWSLNYSQTLINYHFAKAIYPCPSRWIVSKHYLKTSWNFTIPLILIFLQWPLTFILKMAIIFWFHNSYSSIIHHSCFSQHICCQPNCWCSWVLNHNLLLSRWILCQLSRQHFLGIHPPNIPHITQLSSLFLDNFLLV